MYGGNMTRTDDLKQIRRLLLTAPDGLESWAEEPLPFEISDALEAYETALVMAQSAVEAALDEATTEVTPK